jgi:hypothetical protein
LVCFEALLLSLMVAGCGHSQTLTESSGLIHTWRGDNDNPFYFDGSRAAQMPDTPGLDIPDGSPWTLEAWVFPTSPEEQHIAGKRGPCGPGDGFYQIAIGRDTPGKGMGVAQRYVPVNTWTHVALAMDGHRGWNVYANGVLVNTVLAPNWKTRNSGPFLIGGSGTCARFKGVIEEVSLFGRALSATDVQARFAAGRVGPRTPRAITECENEDCATGKIGGNIATWTFEGPRGAALWPRAHTASTLVVERFDGDGVVIRRTNIPGSAAPGLTAIYTGMVSGNNIDGTVAWTWSGFKQGSAKGTWHAQIGSLQAQQQQASSQRAQLESLTPYTPGVRPGTVPNFVAAMLLLGAISGADDSHEISKARINQLESQFLDADSDCRSARSNPRLREDPPSCGRAVDIGEKLDAARQAFNEETQELFAQEHKLASECKAGSKPSCDKDKDLIHQLNLRNGIPEGPPDTHDIWGSFSTAVQ